MSYATWIPGPLRVRWNALRHDLGAIRGAILGTPRPVLDVPHTPAELSALHAAARVERERLVEALQAAREASRMAEIRDLEVIAVERPTRDAVTIVFRNPPEAPVTFTPGQFLTFLVDHDGETLRRSYSLCSDPADAERLAVTVKRVEGGRVSNRLNDAVSVGDHFRARGPSGRFGTTPRPGAARRVVLVGAGAGITPLWSVVQALATAEPESTVEIVYGNRRFEDILFRRELDHLAAAHPNVHVTHALTRPPEFWDGPRGRLAGRRLAKLLAPDPAAEYFVCGPEGMMEGVVAHLRAGGVGAERVHVERFLSRDDTASLESTGAVHRVRFARSGVAIDVADSQTVLDAGLAAGLSLPYSCTMGGCAACKVKVLDGEVAQEEPNALTAEERERGERLLCVGRPRTALVIDA